MSYARVYLAVSSLLIASAACKAQMPAQASELSLALPGQLLADAGLPDSPGATFSSGGSSSSVDTELLPGQQAPSSAVSPQVADKFAITIKAGESAQTLSGGDKFQIGIRKQLTLGALASWNISAGISHLNDSRPHYGTDRAGFGERMGAAALRDTSQSILFYGVYSNLFREDPRYYVLGSQHSAKQRFLYAASRVVVTRKDGGGATGNWALLSAVASSAALTNAYYPDRDRDATRTITGILTSLAARAGTQQLREFRTEIRQRLHLKP